MEQGIVSVTSAQYPISSVADTIMYVTTAILREDYGVTRLSKTFPSKTRKHCAAVSPRESSSGGHSSHRACFPCCPGEVSCLKTAHHICGSCLRIASRNLSYFSIFFRDPTCS
ncbi:hypothetical protein J6590_020121 [Homalodisca vitripennis]|nr:hypothetical protein J6590_020121 [Homalodisca vitripennis]